MSDKGDSVTEVEDLRQGQDAGNGSGSGSGSSNANILDDDSKVPAAHSSDVSPETGAGSGPRRGLQPPEFLLNMSMEERLELETKLKRKIDLRLMPAIIVMYILNYIDRLVQPRYPPPRKAPHPQTRVPSFFPLPRGVSRREVWDPPTTTTSQIGERPLLADRHTRATTETTSRPPSWRAWRRTSGCRRPSTRRPCPSCLWATC